MRKLPLLDSDNCDVLTLLGSKRPDEGRRMLLLLIVTESDWYKNSWHCVAVPVADMIFGWLHGEREKQTNT